MRLPSRADQAKDLCVSMGHMACSHSRGRTGTHPAQPIGFHHREQATVLARIQEHSEPDQASDTSVGFETNQPWPVGPGISWYARYISGEHMQDTTSVG